MGAWTSLPLTTDTLNGFAGLDWKGNAKPDNERVLAAKRLVVTLARARLKDTIVLYSGEVAFFDAVAASVDLAAVRDEMIGFAYLYFHYLDLANRPGNGPVMARKAAEYYNPSAQPRKTGLLMDAITGFVGLAPSILSVEAGQDAADVQGVTTFSGVISVTNSWG